MQRRQKLNKVQYSRSITVNKQGGRGGGAKNLYIIFKGRHKREGGGISRKRTRTCEDNIKMDVEDIKCNFATGSISSGVGPMATHIDSSSLHLSGSISTQTVEQVILTLRRLMSYIYGAPILDVSRSHTTTQHSR